ncbi:MHS family MFS transporter [Arthrobacter sp. GMC3]|uniref:MHS family MFS transporter n=1 Tax=Arthrobacter sp. GMC3 TaxID=2058894 RepID=UPI0011B04DBD|nr:MHS family MFS transporter [Arthrobacter sp. GMC3]
MVGIVYAISSGLAIESMTYALYSALMAEKSPTRVRYTALPLRQVDEESAARTGIN